MIKRTIKTPPQELPSSAAKELDKSTKCVGDRFCAQLFIDLVKVFKPLLWNRFYNKFSCFGICFLCTEYLGTLNTCSELLTLVKMTDQK